MTTVKYTQILEDIDSSAIDNAWYNDNTEDLTLDLHGSTYTYHNVPGHVWLDFKNANSKGHFYHDYIKNGLYGIADHMGYSQWITFSEDVARPVKPLYATTTASSPANVSLSVSEPQPGTRPYKLVFTVGNDETVRNHTVQAADLDNALLELHNLGTTFGLAFKVREATVYFE